MKPIIGITVDAKPDPTDNRTRGKLTLNWNYAQVIADAGGIPVLIPPQADPDAIANLIDGWLIPGGNDIDSAYWGEAMHPKAVAIESERHLQERAIYERLPLDMPVLGVCYGCQFINVMQGGSLIQHLPEVAGHEEDQGGTVQQYLVEPETKTAQAIGRDVATGESWHHQAVGALGAELRVTARNEDGTIEALESTIRPWMVGVQWHPERTSNAEDSLRLFRTFVDAAADFKARRGR